MESRFRDVCVAAARAGGETLLQWRGKIHAREKAPRDLVTEADLASQRRIREILLGAFPDHDFLGEELDGPATAGGGQFRWIVDPLDGTANYVHGLTGYAVSIALEKDSEIVLGAIYDPVCEEMYLAEKGRGSRLNGEPIRTSGCAEIDQAMVAASFSAGVTRTSPEIARFLEMLMACQVVRRLGSAALNLGYVAAGRMDGYWATSVKIWDIAAGQLILTEAGGVMTSLAGEAVDMARPRFAAAATAELNEQMRKVLACVS